MRTAEYSTSKDGYAIARIDNCVYMEMPTRNGFSIKIALMRGKPLTEFEASDFSGSVSHNKNSSFREYIAESIEHQNEKDKLNRVGYPSRQYTPWDRSQWETIYSEGIVLYETPGHGGFHVSPSRLLEMPEPLRNHDGWYEEDCEWAKVAIAFPQLFTSLERKAARKTMIEWHPEIAGLIGISD